jgi:hypothetical protein
MTKMALLGIVVVRGEHPMIFDFVQTTTSESIPLLGGF